MDAPTVTKAEHDEFGKRMESEHERINVRLKMLEEHTKQTTDIAISVKELAISVKQMAEEQKVQNDKLAKLEEHDGEMWRKVVGHIVTVIIGIVVGFLFKQIGV